VSDIAITWGGKVFEAASFCHDRTTPADGRYSIRAGQWLYPHMKLVFQTQPRFDQQICFAVDTPRTSIAARRERRAGVTRRLRGFADGKKKTSGRAEERDWNRPGADEGIADRFKT